MRSDAERGVQAKRLAPRTASAMNPTQGAQTFDVRLTGTLASQRHVASKLRRVVAPHLKDPPISDFGVVSTPDLVKQGKPPARPG